MGPGGTPASESDGRDTPLGAAQTDALGESPEPVAPSKFEAMVEDLLDVYGLTSREVDVARYIYRGFSVKQISLRESISVNTVQSHSRNLYRKLGIHSRQELVEIVDREAE